MKDTGFNLNLSTLESSNVNNSLEEQIQARLTICSNARDAGEADLFLRMLDLIPQEYIPARKRHGEISPNSRLGRELALQKKENNQ